MEQKCGFNLRTVFVIQKIGVFVYVTCQDNRLFGANIWREAFPKRAHTYNVESEVWIAADAPGCIFGTAGVKAAVIRTGALDGECPLLVVDLMGLLRQLHAVFVPMTRWSKTDEEERAETGS